MSTRPPHEQFIDLMTAAQPNMEAADGLLLPAIHSADQMVRMAAVDYRNAEKHVEHLRSTKMRAGLRNEFIENAMETPRKLWLEAMANYDGFRAAEARYHALLREQLESTS